MAHRILELREEVKQIIQELQGFHVSTCQKETEIIEHIFDKGMSIALTRYEQGLLHLNYAQKVHDQETRDAYMEGAVNLFQKSLARETNYLTENECNLMKQYIEIHGRN